MTSIQVLPHHYTSSCGHCPLEAVPANRKDAFNHGLEKRKDQVNNEKARKKGEERCMYRLYAVVVHIGNIVCLFPSFLPFLGANGVL